MNHVRRPGSAAFLRGALKRRAWLAVPLGILLLTTVAARTVVPHAAHLVFGAIVALCTAGTLFGIGYTLVAGLLIRRFFARTPAEPTSFPPVTVVKPLYGGERALLENLSSFCLQDYPGPVQFLFGVQDAADPALEAVELLRLKHPEADITVVADSRLYGPNRKMSNILNMLPQAQHDVLVFADSDVGVETGYLRQIVGELQEPGVGLVTCLYRGQPEPGFWPSLSARASNYQFLPGVVMGIALGRARPCFGQTLAMHRTTLEKIGGFMQFVHHLAEDHAIGEAVRMLGKKVVIPPFAVSHACVETSAAQLIAHERRWSRTIRTIDPAGHLGSALTHPFAFALIVVLLSSEAAWSWALVLGAILARFVLKLQLNRALRQPDRNLGLLPIWDLALFAVFVTSFFSSRVVWRGFSFHVGNDGMLYPVQDE